MRSPAATLASLESALRDARTSGKRVSISGVAKAAGVDPSLIHHCYPQILNAIRALSGTKNREAVSLMKDELDDSKQRIRLLLAEINSLRSDLAQLSSRNLTLQVKLEAMQAAIGGPVEKTSD